MSNNSQNLFTTEDKQTRHAAILRQ